LNDSRVLRGVKITAAVIFSLSVLRLVYVAAPVFEPPVDRLYAEAEKILRSPEGGISHGELERAAELSGVEKVELAAKVEPAAPEAGAGENLIETAPPAESPEPAAAPASEGNKLEVIETLRVQLEECRIRRDEFYLQNDEDGYRREVHRMTNLAKEIGDIENSL